MAIPGWPSREADFELDAYAPYIASVTPPTAIVPLPVPAAEALVHAYEELHALYFKHLRAYGALDAATAKAKGVDPRSSPFLCPETSWFGHVPPGVAAPLEAWASDLASGMKAFPAGCFVRLTTRSPKDSLALRRRRDLADLRGSSTPAALCNTALDVIELLAMSQRVHDDSVAAMGSSTRRDKTHATAAAADASDEFPLKLILREWVECKPGAEFRIFVTDGRVRAISQYATHESFEYLQLQSTVSTVAAQLRRFVEDTVMPLLPTAYRTAVVDALIDPDNIGAAPQVIELNPFMSKTGSGLFRWGLDLEQLTTCARIEFRTRALDGGCHSLFLD